MLALILAVSFLQPKFDTLLPAPGSIAVDRNDNIWYATNEDQKPYLIKDPPEARLFKLDLNGNILLSTALGHLYVPAIKADSAGNVYLAGSDAAGVLWAAKFDRSARQIYKTSLGVAEPQA